VGRTEQQCRDEGLDYVSAEVAMADVAYGWAMEDRTGLCKILAERGTGRILGAHIIGPQAPAMIHLLSVARTFDIDATELSSRPYWIHPALTEVIDNAPAQPGPLIGTRRPQPDLVVSATPAGFSLDHRTRRRCSAADAACFRSPPQRQAL